MEPKENEPIQPEGRREAPAEPETIVESREAPEQSLNAEPEAQEVFQTPEGEVYQMPAHDDPSDNPRAHAERIAPLPEEEKLWQLKLLARDKGLEKAIAVIKKLDDPWLEDKFHDDLMDDPEWRAQLEALGKIEKL